MFAASGDHTGGFAEVESRASVLGPRREIGGGMELNKESVALVTGAGSGIGRALAAALAARGARVIAVDIDAAAARATAEALGGAALAADLARSETAAELIGAAHARYGRLDLVCSNAGIGRNKRLLKEDLGAPAARLFAVNFYAALHIAQAYAAVIKAARGQGRLLITASENALSVPAAVRGAGLGLYAASKHALLIAAEWLRDEVAWAGLDLSVHVLLPGAVATPLTGIAAPAAAPAALHMISPQRCAELALRGMDAGLFYIPTQAHMLDDMKPRADGIAAAARALGLLA